MKVGFVGLGTMGFPMARCLVDHGHEVACSSRSPGPVRRLAQLGARSMSCPSEVISASDVTFLCLPDDDAVRTVVTECLEVVAGRVVVDCSTVGPETERHLGRLVESSGGDYLDAPVSGGPTGAAAGNLAVMAGGNPVAFFRARLAIEAFASYIDLVGEVGAGQVVKLCNQVIVGAQMLALAECARLAELSGIDATRLHEALRHSTADCVMGRIRFPVPGVVATSPASNDWRPDFTTVLMAKDLRLADEYARQAGAPLRSVEALRELLIRNIDRGNGHKDFSSFAALLSDGTVG